MSKQFGRYVDYIQSRNQKTRALYLLSLSSILIFLTIAVTLPFKNQLLNRLYPKSQQQAALTDLFITPGQMNLTTTYNTVGLELFFDGDANKNAQATLEFKKKTEVSWRKGLELWGTYAATSPGPAFYGSALLLDPGTEYDIKVTIADPDGVTGTSVITGAITTRADNIPDAATLNPTHFVRIDGNDTNSGTTDTAAGAWKTINKAISSAPSGAIVQVGPGSYPLPKATRTTPITLKAQFPAVDDNNNPINKEKLSILEPQEISLPNQGTWTRISQDSLLGPGSGQTFPRSNESLWKWTGAPISDFITTINVAESRDPLVVPYRVNRWARDTSKVLSGYNMQTPEGWAEILFLNGSYRHGFTTFGKDIYMRLPGDKNPNNYFVWISNGFDDENALRFNGPDTRVTGFFMRMHNIQYNVPASNGIFDHNFIYNTRIRFGAIQSTTYPKDFLVENNRAIASGFWSTNPEWPGMPWWYIKGGVGISGVAGEWRVGKYEETDGTFIYGRGGANRLVVRNNYIDGYFNGVSGYNSNYDRYSQQDTDIYNNTFRQIGDDVFEPEGQAINWRAWDNKVDNSSVFMSIGPVNWGPLYVFRNVTSNLGNHGMTRSISTNDPGVFGKFFKYSGSSGITARLWVINNTFHNVTAGFDGADNSAGGGSTPESFYLRNNILTATRYIWSNGPFGEPRLWNEDYNHFYTSDPGNRGLRDRTNIDWYRSSWPPNGVHTNRSADLKDPWIFSQFQNPSSGDMRLIDTSSLINAGIAIPNIYDNYDTKSSYIGSAPDLGAIESSGQGGPIPTAAPTSSQPEPTITTTQTPTPTPVDENTIILQTESDSYVSSVNPDSNYGTATQLLIDNEPEKYISYLKFDTSQLAGKQIQKAVLRLRIGSEESFNTETIKSVADNTWLETSLNYTNRPALGSTLGTITSNGIINTWVETDISSYVIDEQGKPISLGIEGSYDGTWYSSRETQYKPEIRITLTSPTGGVGGVSPSSKLSLTPATASRSVGQTLDTTVRIETQNSVTNADIALTFNPQILEIVSVTPGTFLPGATEAQEQIDNTTGKLFYSLYTDSSNAKSGTGTLASIQWRAKGAGSSTVSFNSQTTIVYAPGIGNSLVTNGLTGGTYTVTAVVNPTATPTNAPTATPTQAPPTPTNTPTPVPCTLQNATWSTAAAGNGEQVTLRVTTNGSASCIGKQVSFDIHENDSIAEGGLDDNVTTNPANVSISATTVTRTWSAEWQNDCGGFCNPNEFYFNAQIVGQSGSSIRSAEPYLSISETATPVYTLQVQLNKNVTVATIPNVEVQVSGPEGTITKSITLNKTTTAGIYQGSLPLLVDPGTYTLSIRLPGYLVKKYTVSITSTSTAINVSNQPLLAGDVDGNNIVNTLDLGQTIEEYSPEATTTSTADTTFDDKVNALDLGLIIENYFKSGE